MTIAGIIVGAMLSAATSAPLIPERYTISAEAADYFCDHQVHYDHCSYLPLYESAYSWMGTPYRWAGTTRKGVDCAALVRNVYKEAYGMKLSGNAISFANIVEPVQKEDLQEGDLIFWAIGSKSITHVGIYLRDGYFVHATTGYGVRIDHLSAAYYTRWYHSAGRL
jgi:lipoprotein Spr